MRQHSTARFSAFDWCFVQVRSRREARQKCPEVQPEVIQFCGSAASPLLTPVGVDLLLLRPGAMRQYRTNVRLLFVVVSSIEKATRR